MRSVYSSDTYREGQFLASEDPDTRDAAVVVGAKQDDAGEGILSEFVQTLEHTCEKQREYCLRALDRLNSISCHLCSKRFHSRRNFTDS